MEINGNLGGKPTCDIIKMYEEAEGAGNGGSVACPSARERPQAGEVLGRGSPYAGVAMVESIP